jgi:glycerophosphoryl diester phosphodiesterase
MKQLSTLCLAMFVVSMLVPLAAQADTSKPFFSKPFIFGAHRCGMKWRPESTFKTFQEAAKRWPDLMIETDTRVTKDGVAVFLHDSKVDRTTNGTGAIADLTWAEVEKLDAGYNFSSDNGETFPYRDQGYKISKVVDVLRAMPDSHFLIEIKDQPRCAEVLTAAILEADAVDRVCLASFNPEQMKIAKNLAPTVATCFDAGTIPTLLAALRGENWDAYVPEADMLIMNYHQLARYGVTKDDFPKLQAKGIPICVYNIDDEFEIHEVLDLGLDSMLTNKPDSLARILGKRNLR